jgi:hypothetical protein
MSNLYRLVNPTIQGDMKTSVKSKNSATAARTLYKNLSEHFSNNIPKFHFTIQKGGSGKGKYYHFVVKEMKTNADEVSFNIEPYTIENESYLIGEFEGKLKSFTSKFQKAGGKAKKSSKKSRKSTEDSEFFDSDEEIYVNAQTYRPIVGSPMYYWWYDSKLYNLKSLYLPTFYPYVLPYVQVV